MLQYLMSVLLVNSIDTADDWNQIRRGIDDNNKYINQMNNDVKLIIKMESERLKIEREEDSLFRSIKPDKYYVKDKIFRNGIYKDTIYYLTPAEIDAFIEKKKGNKK